MAALTVYARSADPTFVDAGAAGDTFVNDGATELLIMHQGVSAVTVTFAATKRCKHGFLDDEEHTVQPSELYRAGPFAASRFNDSQGRVAVSYSDETVLQVAAQRQR